MTDSSNKGNPALPGSFDPIPILSQTDAMISVQDAFFIHELASRTHASGALVEIGSYRGGSTCCLAEAARIWNGKVIAIEPREPFTRPLGGVFTEDDRQTFLRNVEKLHLENFIDYRRTTSHAAAGDWTGPIDFIFIDGNHLKEAVIQDILDWKRFVRVGGVIALHDAHDRGDVDEAIDETLLIDSEFIEIRTRGDIRAFRRHSGSLEMILCCGLQSGGTTLVSWCFLHRPDMSGVLDMWTEAIELMPYVSTPLGWCKMTVSCFRWQDVADFYSDMGWVVRPLMVVRDVRSAYASLRQKPYGLNGTTAEDPPLRTRLKRFLRDWEQFRRNGWPTVRFESLLSSPEATLRAACEQLDLPWYDEMLTWPKSDEEVGEVEWANETFQHSLSGSGFQATMMKDRGAITIEGISVLDLTWLQNTFSEYNRENNYRPEIPAHGPASLPDRPDFAATQRHRAEAELNTLKTRLTASEAKISEMLESRSWKITAPFRRFYDCWTRKKN